MLEVLSADRAAHDASANAMALTALRELFFVARDRYPALDLTFGSVGNIEHSGDRRIFYIFTNLARGARDLRFGGYRANDFVRFLEYAEHELMPFLASCERDVERGRARFRY